MSKLASTLRSGVAALHFHPRSMILLLIILLFAFAATAIAQEDSDQPEIPEMEILSETALPYGVQTVASVPAIQDAFIASGQPNTAFGSLTSTRTTMRLGYEAPSYQAMRSLMQFDFSPVPPDAQVNSATLNIYQSVSNPPYDAPMGFKAQYMTAPWNESSVTWNTANYLGGATIGIGNNTSTLGWKQSNVTDLVRSWVSGTEYNYGVWTWPVYHRRLHDLYGHDQTLRQHQCSAGLVARIVHCELERHGLRRFRYLLLQYSGEPEWRQLAYLAVPHDSYFGDVSWCQQPDVQLSGTGRRQVW